MPQFISHWEKGNALYKRRIKNFTCSIRHCAVIGAYVVFEIACFSHTHTCGPNKKNKLTQPNKNSCLFAQIRMMFPKETSKEKKKNRKTFHSDRALQVTFHFLVVFLPLFVLYFSRPASFTSLYAMMGFCINPERKIEFPFCTLGYAKIQLIWV